MYSSKTVEIALNVQVEKALITETIRYIQKLITIHYKFDSNRPCRA